MLVVMDVGNTNVVIGVFEDKMLVNSWRMTTDKGKTSDEIGMFLANLFVYNGISIESIDDVIISSVVPPIMFSFERAIKKYLRKDPINVDATNAGMNVKYGNPKELGADRIVNAVAAYEVYGGSIIIIDFGTATTFCSVNESGEYLGGAICPGIKISADALFDRTAKLPKVELSLPDKMISNDTVESMQAGILYGYIGLVDYIVNKMKSEMNEQNIKVIATGGLATLIASKSEVIDEVNPLLTLEGLRLLYNRLKM